MKICCTLFVAITLLGAASFGQTGGQAQSGALPSILAPRAGREAKRWEPWSAMRMAAAGILGWKIGVAAESFPRFTLSTALELTDELSLSYFEASSDEKVNDFIPKDLDWHLQPGEIKAVKDKLFALNMRIVAYRVPVIGPDEESASKLFAFAKDLNIETIISTQLPSQMAPVEKLADQNGINVAICGKWKTTLDAVEGHSHRIGVCGDTSSWLQQGIKPTEAIAEAKDRILVLNINTQNGLGRSSHDLQQLLQSLYRGGIKPSLITVESMHVNENSAGLSRSLDAFEKAMQPIMATRVDEMSRAAAIRSPASLSVEDKEKIDAALPSAAPVKPKKPRKLLVLDLNIAYGGHRSIPAENYALETMGKKTGAYEAIFNNDLDNLKYPKIKDFDAVYLNNTVGMIFVDPEVREGLVRFVREGGGLGGNHGTSHASMDWAEFHEMIGVTRGVHRQSTEKFWVKIDDPNSPLTAAFHGQEFEYQDEFFRFVNPPYSREKLHVLLSMDVARTDMNQGVPFMPGSIARPDSDYAVSWIRSYGNGRIFFCILGHNPTLFQTPQLAQYFLAGIQFMLGDLKADTMPSAKLSAASTSKQSAALRK